MTLEEAKGLTPWESKVRDTDGSEWLFRGIDEEGDIIVNAPSGKAMYLYRDRLEVV
jgi:hypothetical protein